MKLISVRYRPWIVYAGCTLLAVAILTSNLRGGIAAAKLESLFLSILTPLHSSVDTIIEYSGSAWDHYIDLRGVQEENDRLKLEVTTLRNKLAPMRDAVESVDRYRAILGFNQRFSGEKTVADVVRGISGRWTSTILINAGSRAGIRVAMGVAANNGVFGQIISVSPGMSKAQSILHPDTGVSARLVKSRVQGIVSGSGTGVCRMKYASRFDRVILGELAVTSGLDGAFPPNIPIGRVTRIERIPGEIFQHIEITPEITVSDVEHVTVFLSPDLEPLP